MPRQFITHSLRAFVLTMFTAASVHLLILTLWVLSGGQHGVMNPIIFLGIDLVLPNLASSSVWFALGWVALVALFFMYLFIFLSTQRSRQWAKDPVTQADAENDVSQPNDAHSRTK